MADKRLLDNWIAGYMTYTAESESPDVFHRWSALSTIAGALRRKVFFDMGYFMVYPNLYTVLVSPPGRCKKSTALREGQKMLSTIPNVHLTTDSVTRERLILDMSQSLVDGHSSMTCYSSELATLLTSSGMDMVAFLTDIYDSPNEWSHRTKMGGTNTIKGPYLNMMAATTPKWIASSMPLDTVGIGLTSRVVFVYEENPRVRSPFPILSSAQKTLRELLVEDINLISTLSGQYTMDDRATEYYIEWYKERTLKPNPSGDERLSGYFERKPIHLIKVAMIVAAARHDTLVITEEDLRLAFAFLEENEIMMPRVFVGVGKNPLAYDETVVYDLIVAEPGVVFGELLRVMSHSINKEELAMLLDQLVLMGKITAKPVGRTTGYFAA